MILIPNSEQNQNSKNASPLTSTNREKCLSLISHKWSSPLWNYDVFTEICSTLVQPDFLFVSLQTFQGGRLDSIWIFSTKKILARLHSQQVVVNQRKLIVDDVSKQSSWMCSKPSKLNLSVVLNQQKWVLITNHVRIGTINCSLVFVSSPKPTTLCKLKPWAMSSELWSAHKDCYCIGGSLNRVTGEMFL